VKLRVCATARKLSKWVGSNMTDPVIVIRDDNNVSQGGSQ
jgi:hypothetical protein